MPSLAATTSTDTGFIAHHHNSDHWRVYGVNGAMLSDADHPASTMFAVWQNCTQNQQS